MKTTNFLAVVLPALLFVLPVHGVDGPFLQKGDVVEMCGDSITEQNRYTVFVAAYLAVCQPVPDVTVIQKGKGGATADSFNQLIEATAIPFHPSVVTLCYGMNDGDLAVHQASMEEILNKFKKAGVRDFVVGTPGIVGAGPEAPNNIRLATISKMTKDLADKYGTHFAELHEVMTEARKKAIAKYGDKYLVCGQDGVHPNDNGHLIMAYGFLKGFGFKGDIATFTVDMKANTANATEGNKVVSYANGTLALESTRYPFCFHGDPANPDATTGMIEFIPFNQELNRYMLVVKNAPAPQMKVTWGKTSKTFSAEQLAAGINLAAEFLDNPFSGPFNDLIETLRQQQHIDLRLDGPESLLEDADNNRKLDPSGKIYDQTVQAVVQFEAAERAATLKKIVPVSHSIVIESAGN